MVGVSEVNKTGDTGTSMQDDSDNELQQLRSATSKYQNF
jgi:hypothetical protein